MFSTYLGYGAPALTTATIGKRGTIVIPKELRDRLQLVEGSLVIIEASDGSVVIRPAIAVPVEEYDMRRKAELLLNNAVDLTDYKSACDAVRGLGLDPAQIPHEKPAA